MPDPLPTECSRSLVFAECVQLYTNEIYALSFMLLQQSAEAEKVTIHTFHELRTIYNPNNCDPLHFSIEAYRSCIGQCADGYAHRSLLSAKEAFPWEEQLIKALWYGLKLSLAQISIILQKSIPALKAQLRHVREQMTAALDSQPTVNTASVSWYNREAN